MVDTCAQRVFPEVSPRGGTCVPSIVPFDIKQGSQGLRSGCCSCCCCWSCWLELLPVLLLQLIVLLMLQLLQVQLLQLMLLELLLLEGCLVAAAAEARAWGGLRIVGLSFTCVQIESV